MLRTILVSTVARSRQVCINWVVEALLEAIYLTEKKDVYIRIRPTLSPEANLPPGAYPAEPSSEPCFGGDALLPHYRRPARPVHDALHALHALPG
jgi:hypothetical protein